MQYNLIVKNLEKYEFILLQAVLYGHKSKSKVEW